MKTFYKLLLVVTLTSLFSSFSGSTYAQSDTTVFDYDSYPFCFACGDSVALTTELNDSLIDKTPIAKIVEKVTVKVFFFGCFTSDVYCTWNGQKIGTKAYVSNCACNKCDSLEFTLSGVDALKLYQHKGPNYFTISNEFSSTMYIDRIEVVREFGDRAPIDAGVCGVNEPSVLACSGSQSIKVDVRNLGKTKFTGVDVAWTWNGVTQTTITHSGAIDTLGSSGGNSAEVTLGSKTFTEGKRDTLVAWSEDPGSTSDTVNYNDTLKQIFLGAYKDTIVVGASGADFTTIQGAIDALMEFGVCGPTVVSIKPGTYTEQLVLGPIPGSDTANMVKFTSSTGDSSDVVISYSSTSSSFNFTWQFLEASNIIIANLTIEALGTSYGRAVWMYSNLENIRFLHCLIAGVTGSTTSTSMALVYRTVISYLNVTQGISFEDCRFAGGSYGIYAPNGSGGNSSDFVISNCLFLSQYYMNIYIRYMSNLVIMANFMELTSAYAYGQNIYTYGTFGQLLILNNVVHALSGAGNIYTSFHSGSSLIRSVIANNFLVAISALTYGNSNSCYLDGCSYLDFIFNNLNRDRAMTGSALTVDEGSLMRVYNNNIINRGMGNCLNAISTASSNPTLLDYNNYYNGGGALASVWGKSISSLSDFLSKTKTDSNSVSTDPSYASAMNLHAFSVDLDGNAMPDSLIAHDIDGAMRDTTPDIGANEFDLLSADAGLLKVGKLLAGPGCIEVVLRNFGKDTLKTVDIDWVLNGTSKTTISWSGALAKGDTSHICLDTTTISLDSVYKIKAWTSDPNSKKDSFPLNDTLSGTFYAALSGDYTIGGSSPDFVSFDSAIAALHRGGVIDSARFLVRNDTFTEQLVINSIPCVEGKGSVIFQSESGDSSKVILEYTGTSSSANYVVLLDGAVGITFRSITIQNKASYYNTAVELRGSCGNILFDRCHIRNDDTSSTGFYQYLVRSYLPGGFNICFTHNLFENGSKGIDHSADYSNRTDFYLIKRNEFMNQNYQALDMNYVNKLYCNHNTVVSMRQYFEQGFYFSDMSDSSTINGNDIYIDNEYASTGIDVYSYYDLQDTLCITNNMISIASDDDARGLECYYLEPAVIAHNSIWVRATDSSSSSSAFYFYDGRLIVLNNIFAHTEHGYAIYCGDEWVIHSDRNDLFSNSSVPVYWDGTSYSSLAAYQTGEVQDTSSFVSDPLFKSKSDLHASNVSLNAVAIPMGKVMYDFDGDMRDTTPDVGADEFTPPARDIGVSMIHQPGSILKADTTDVIVVVYNYGLDSITEFTVQGKVNSTNLDSLKVTKTLGPGDTARVNLGSYPFVASTAYTISAWTSKPNNSADQNISNDTVVDKDRYAAMSGIYTIGGSGPDFSNFKEAVTALNIAGISDTVIFKVRNGTYTEQIRMTQVKGVFGRHSIIFESENQDSTKVILTYASTKSDTNYTVHLDGVDGITFRHLTIQATGTSFGRVFHIDNEATLITISNNVIEGRAVSSTTDRHTLIYSPSDADDGLWVECNLLTEGSVGIYLYEYRPYSPYGGASDIRIRHNTFEGNYGYYAIYCSSINELLIEGNRIDFDGYTYGYGMYCYRTYRNLKILNNDLTMHNGYYGIYTEYHNGSSGQNLIANNFLAMNAPNNSSMLGIYARNCDSLNILYNSISIDNSFTGHKAIQTVGSSSYECSVMNNNVDAGHGLALSQSISTWMSDYNNIFTKGSILAEDQTTTYSNFADWQASGKDSNSLNFEPKFFSSTDLHTQDLRLNEKAMPTPLVSGDIDFALRDTTSPDIGADEFSPPPLDAGISDVITPKMPFLSDTQTVKVVLYNYGSDTLSTVSIYWQMNGSSQTTVNWSGKLATGDTAQVALGSWFFEQDSSYDFKSWTSDPNTGTDSDAANDTMELFDQFPALHGNYTLGGGSADFDSFATVIRALNRGGVYQWARFKIRTGTYKEQLAFGRIIGADTKNALIFESESGDSSDVWISSPVNSSSANYTIFLDSTRGLTFRNLSISTAGTSYSRLVYGTGGNRDICFSNCRFLGYSSSSTSSNRAIAYFDASIKNAEDRNIAFDSSQFDHGSNGIYVDGYFSGNRCKEFYVRNCVFRSPYYQGVYLNYCDDAVVTMNDVEHGGLIYGSSYSIRLRYSDRFNVSSNRVYNSNYGGIWIEYSHGTSVDSNLISNNMVSVNSTGSQYGLYFYSASYTNILHNNVFANSSYSSSYAMYIGGSSSFLHRNNCYAHSGTGYAAYFSSYPTGSDYNNYFGNGTNLIYRSGNYTTLASYQSSTSLDSHSVSVDPDYVSTSDLHVRETDLNGAGWPNSIVMYDFDGEMRDSLPDIGADEFEIPAANDAGIIGYTNPIAPFTAGTNSVLAVIKNFGSDSLKSATIHWSLNSGTPSSYNWTGGLKTGETDTVNIGSSTFSSGTLHTIDFWTSIPNGNTDSISYNDSFSVKNLIPALSGDYTVGPTATDFSSIASAVNALQLGGILDSVNFKLQSTTFNESVELKDYPGSNSMYPVCFESSTGISTNTIWKPSGKDYMIYLNGADNIQFKNMTFDSKSVNRNTSIEMDNSSNNCLVEGNIFDMRSSGSYYYYQQYGIASFSDDDDSLVVRGNTFNNGHYGVYCYGISSSTESGIEIDSNQFNATVYQAVRLVYASAPIVTRNTVTSPWLNTSSYAISMYNCSGELLLARNSITRANANAFGIEIYNLSTTAAKKATIKNNFISINGSSSSIYGLYMYSSDYIQLWNNSIHVYGGYPSSTAFFSSYNSSLDARNNIFSNGGGGYAYQATSTSWLSSDYNDYYSSGTNLSRINSTDQTSLSALQSATSKDANSISVNPTFFSNTDLHTGLVNLDSSGQVISSVTVDIDGDARNSTHPDIGADEFNSLPRDLGVLAILSPVTDCELDTVKVKLSLFNYGNTPQASFPVKYQLNGGSVQSETVSDTIKPGKSLMHEFSIKEVLSPSSTNSIKAWTDLSTEQYYANDTANTTVVNYPVPDSVTSMVPSDSSTDLSYPVSLSWLPSTGATHYDIYIWDTGVAKPSSPTYSNRTQISQQINSGLTYGATYYWQVIAKNQSCSTPGKVQMFTMKYLPDLVVTSVTVPSSAFSSTSVSVNWKVKNIGQGNSSGTWYDRLYLSSDNIFGSDIYMGEFSNPSAPDANDDYSNTASINLPNGISGTYHIFVVTDYRNSLLETNNGNNVARDSSGGMAVSLTPPPDLIVSSVIAPAQGFSGATANITFQVKNDGTGPTRSGQWYDRIYITSDTTLSSSRIHLKTIQHNGDLQVDSTYTAMASVTLPNHISGKRFIIVKSDYANHEYEHASENNNENHDSMNVILTPPPDLIVKDLVIQDTVSNKEFASISYNTINDGGTSTGRGFYDAIYLSANPVLNIGSATHVATRYNTTLESGDSAKVKTTIQIPSNLNGLYYVFVVTDFLKYINEVDKENNNESDYDTTRILSPDLTIPSVVVDTLDTTGHTTPIEYVLKNNGPGTDFGGTRVDSIYIDTAKTFGSTAVGIGRYYHTTSILSGESDTINTMVTIPDGLDGTRYFYVKADAGKQVFENGNETNNVGMSDSMNIHLAPYADLVPLIVEAPDSSAAGDLISIKFKISNEGDTTAFPTWEDRIYLSTDSSFDKSADLLLATSTRSTQLLKSDDYDISSFISLPSNLIQGDYYFILFTDFGERVFEHDKESNNIFITDRSYIDGYPPIDLKVDCPSIVDSMGSGKTYPITYKVTNQGDATTAAGFWIDGIYLSKDDSLSANDKIIGSYTRSGNLSKGGSYTVTPNVTIPNGLSGDYYVLVRTDTSDRNVDVDLDNNVKAACDGTSSPKLKKIGLTPSPDLKITSWTIPSTGTSGQLINIKWTVKNDGAGPTTWGSWVDNVWLSTDYTIDGGDYQLGSYTRTGNLSSGNSYSVDKNFTIPSNRTGNYIVIIQTDAANVVYEHNGENNNIASSISTFSKAPPADLVVSQIISPSAVISGNAISITWKIKNTGSNPASGYCTDNIYLSLDKKIDGSDLLLGSEKANLSLGQNAELSRTKNYTVNGVPLGDYYVLIRTDVLNGINESNDTNNTASSFNKLSVSVPLLTIGTKHTDTLHNGKEKYFRFLVPDSLEGESLLITLKGDSVSGNNEMYVRFTELATASSFEQKHRDPFQGNQEIIIPEVEEGTYYLMIKGSTSPATYQNFELLIEVLPFKIRKVTPNSGGQNGEVTLKIEGSKFDSSMTFYLGEFISGVTPEDSAAHTYSESANFQDGLELIDPTLVFATFDLSDIDTGLYDLIAEKIGGRAIAKDAFTVEESSAEDLQIQINRPANTRSNVVIDVKILFTNKGNNDLVGKTIEIVSTQGAPIALTPEGLAANQTTLELPVEGSEGPPGRLAAGASGSAKIYIKSSAALGIIINK